MYTIWKYWKILLEMLDIVQKSLWISSHFETENYTWRLNIGFLSEFFETFVSIYILQII